MLRQTRSILENIRILSPIDISTVLETPTCYQCVRWRRKPRWIPVAKSKMFRVPERYNTPEEEKIELTRLQNCYNTQMKAIRAYLRQQLADATSVSELTLVQAKQEEEDLVHCMKLNEEWNTEVAKVREKRLAQEAEVAKEKILRRLIEHEKAERERLEQIEKIVREEKERAKLYITADNIDEAIEKALANEVDYNFSIDLEGNKYHGHNTKPADAVAKNQEKIQVPAQASS